MSATDKAALLDSEYATSFVAGVVSERPLFIIRPSTNWPGLNLQEIWQCRELLYFLIWRDIKLRYKQTALGAIWAIIQPLLPMLIFTLFFGRLAHLPSNGIAYSLFAYAGLLPWTYFSNAVSNSSSSVVGNANLVTKVYFPRMLIPLSGVLAALVDFFIASVILVAMMIWHRVPLCISQLWIPLILSGNYFARGRDRYVICSTQRAVSRYSICAAFFCSVLDVCDPGDLSRKPGTCKMAMAACSESSGRDGGGISRGTLWNGTGMENARDLHSGRYTYVDLFRLLFPAC